MELERPNRFHQKSYEVMNNVKSSQLDKPHLFLAATDTVHVNINVIVLYIYLFSCTLLEIKLLLLLKDLNNTIPFRIYLECISQCWPRSSTQYEMFILPVYFNPWNVSTSLVNHWSAHCAAHSIMIISSLSLWNKWGMNVRNKELHG